MPNQFILEICVESLDHAVAAERGGADRLELCSDLPSGGVTPSAELMQAARRQVSIPIHVLIRPRAGDFCYSDDEFGIMRREIQAASRATGAKAAKDALQALKAQNPEIGQSARLGNGPRRWQPGARAQQGQSQQAAQQPDPPQF